MGFETKDMNNNQGARVYQYVHNSLEIQKSVVTTRTAYLASFKKPTRNSCQKTRNSTGFLLDRKITRLMERNFNITWMSVNFG